MGMSLLSNAEPSGSDFQVERAGTMIGRYKLLEKIGEGGCGIVYMAQQEEPVRRLVALKVIKLGMDTRSVIARFEAERQALALMDHPNIAKVLEAGATDTGRPYFVMELVRGRKITRYCDENNLTTEARLDLFIQVSQAIQHAHQKGIIHRDIKPSNILVADHDGVPVPKVIDFGIAKATTNQRLTDKTLFTAFEQFIGTPAYMSPEQARMSGLDIDTRTDIYSLGVLLYELLTGKTPFDAQDLLAGGLDEMRRTISEQEPARPSSCLSTMLEGELTTTAKHRHIDAPKLIHLLRGDLDWIVMKALEKDRARRYETANGLAMDVQRYLADEPVVARPPGNFYRFQKLVRRNKLAFCAVAAASASLLAGSTVSTWLFLKEREGHRRALAAEREQVRLRQRADAQSASDKIAAAALYVSQGFFDKAEQLINQVPPAWQSNATPNASEVFASLGDWYGRTERWPPAISNLTKAIELNPSEHWAYFCLAPLLIKSGNHENYRDLRRRMLILFSRTATPTIADRMAKACLILSVEGIDPAFVVSWSDTAVTVGRTNRYIAYFQCTKGLVEYRQGHFRNAVDCIRQAITSLSLLDDPCRVQAYAVLAMAYYQLNEIAMSRDALTKAAGIVETQVPHLNSGDLGRNWSDVLVAHALLDEANALIEGTASIEHERQDDR